MRENKIETKSIVFNFDKSFISEANYTDLYTIVVKFCCRL